MTHLRKHLTPLELETCKLRGPKNCSLRFRMGRSTLEDQITVVFFVLVVLFVCFMFMYVIVHPVPITRFPSHYLFQGLGCSETIF